MEPVSLLSPWLLAGCIAVGCIYVLVLCYTLIVEFKEFLTTRGRKGGLHTALTAATLLLTLVLLLTIGTGFAISRALERINQ